MEYKTELDLNKRWEEGIDHHEKSIELYRFIAGADFKLNRDYFCFKSGGDGDNGEALLYLMDIYFEAIDNGELEKIKKHINSPTK